MSLAIVKPMHFNAPRSAGPQPRTAQELNFSPPTLAGFLNTCFERVEACRSNYECFLCVGNLCDEQHGPGPLVMATMAAQRAAQPLRPNPPGQPRPMGKQSLAGQPYAKG
jgi:hypothetical protein